MSAATTLVARDPRAPIGLAPGQSATARRGRPVDWILLGAALSLALIGAVCVWSATRTTLIADGRDPQLYLFRHLLNIGIGAALLLGVMRLDAHLLRYTAAVGYAAALLGLLAVFGIGSTVNGAHAWIRIGAGFELQPSEFMKVGLIAGLAVLFGQRSIGRISQTPTSSDVCLALALVAVPLGLIMLQPDLGSAMVLSTAAFGVFIAAGVRARWTIGLLVAAMLGIVVAVKAGMLAQYQIERFTAFTHPGVDTQGAAYNVTQAHIAIANGGLFGTGLFHGPQTRGAFVPEQQTDFVYSVAAEELGFIGAVAIIALFALLCWRGLKIAAAADRTGRLLAVGIICWFAFQSFQNIGMNLGLMPVTGLPLPFVSYGGSSMFAQALAIGLLQAVQRRTFLSTE